MSRHLFAAGVIVLLAVLSIDLTACGDKFLRPGRSSKWQSYAAMHPASIILLQSASAKPEVAKDWQKMLKHAGHKSLIVAPTDDLSRALASGPYDVVIAAYGDVAKVQSALDGASAKPGVLPVLSKMSKAQLELVKKEYQVVIDAGSMDRYEALLAIDHLMERRLKTPALASRH
jgi:hypothetical protein